MLARILNNDVLFYEWFLSFLGELQNLLKGMDNVAPQELLSVYPDALNTVMRALESSDTYTVVLALQTIGRVGSTMLGKRLLYKSSMFTLYL